MFDQFAAWQIIINIGDMYKEQLVAQKRETFHRISSIQHQEAYVLKMGSNGLSRSIQHAGREVAHQVVETMVVVSPRLLREPLKLVQPGASLRAIPNSDLQHENLLGKLPFPL